MDIESIIDNCAIEFEKIIPFKPFTRKRLVEEYKEYLRFSINAILNSSIPYIQKDQQSIMEMLEDELIEFKEEGLDSIIITIRQDLAFEQIKAISEKVFIQAIEVLNGGQVKKDMVDQLSEKVFGLKNHILKVKPHNRIEAEKLFSEAVLDLHYIKNPQSEGTSLRIGYIISNMNTKKEEKARD